MLLDGVRARSISHSPLLAHVCGAFLIAALPSEQTRLRSVAGVRALWKVVGRVNPSSFSTFCQFGAFEAADFHSEKGASRPSSLRGLCGLSSSSWKEGSE